MKRVAKHAIAFLFVTIAGAFALVTPASAQIAAGLNEVGGKGYVETGKLSTEEDRSTEISLNVYYGRFVTDRIVVGPQLNYFKFGDEDASGLVGGFVNYHFGDTARKVAPFVEVAAGKEFGGADGAGYVAVGPGVKWFLGEGGGAFIASANYRRNMADTADTNEFYLSVGVSIFFGR